MRHQYLYLDPELIQALLAGLDLLRLFNQLVLATGGDVEEAMDWMRYLQQQGHLPEEIDLEAVLRQPGEPEPRGPRRRGRPPAHGRRRAHASAAAPSRRSSRPSTAPARATTRSAPLARASSASPRRAPTISATTSTSSTPPARSRTPSGASQGGGVQPRRGGSGGLRDRAPDLLRHGRRHRHQPLDDPLRRGPHHPGQDRGPGPDRADHHQVPEGPPLGDPLRRRGRAGLPLGDPLHRGRAVPHEHPRRPAALAQHPAPARSSPTSRSS